MLKNLITEDLIVYEDASVVVFNKPNGLSVLGERHDMDLLQMLKAQGRELKPVHRIDKETSGVIVFAKHAAVHAALSRQFNHHAVEKNYLAIVQPGCLPERGIVELPLSIGRKNRVRVAADRDAIRYDGETMRWFVAPGDLFQGRRTYQSLSVFLRVLRTSGGDLLLVQPVSGRRHQIRVHLAWIGAAICGDPLFKHKSDAHKRMHLHARQICYNSSWDKQGRRCVVINPDPGFYLPVENRNACDLCDTGSELNCVERSHISLSDCITQKLVDELAALKAVATENFSVSSDLSL